MRITEQTLVSDVASALPSSVRVFQRHGIDFCCGGRTPLGLACEQQGVPFHELEQAIRASAAEVDPQDRDWSREPLGALIDHIVKTYHDVLREELPRLETLASRVAQAHGEKSDQLKRIDDVVGELAADLQSHMQKEERVLFPAIRAIENSAGSPPFAITAPIAVMEHEHDHAGVLLAELRELTRGYAPPVWACETFRALYHGLAELESAMHVHVHLENNVLFPRAIAVAHG